MENVEEKLNKHTEYSTRAGENTFGREQREKKTKDGDRAIKRKTLSPYQWGELLGMLQTGYYSQTELAEMYDISPQTIFKKRKEIEEKLGKKIEIGKGDTKNNLKKAEETSSQLKEAAAFSITEAGNLINEVRRKTFKRNKAIGQLAEGYLQEGYKSGNLEIIKDKVKVLIDVQALFEKELRISSLCLGFKEGEYGTVDEIPVLTIHKMTDEDVEREKNKINMDDNEDDFFAKADRLLESPKQREDD